MWARVNDLTNKAGSRGGNERIIVAFLKRAAEMERPAYIRSGMPLHLSIRRNENNELVGEPLDLDEDQIRSAFMAIRPFVLKKEPTYLLRVYGACRKVAASTDLQQNLRVWRERRDRRNKWGGIGPGAHWTSEKIIDLYFHSRYFHFDAEKEDEIGDLPDEIGIYLLISAAISVVDAITALVPLAERALAEVSGVSG